MFRRTFWFTAGAAAGVWATTKVHRTLRQLTPESLAAQAANKAIDAGHRLKDFALDVRVGMAQREAELGEALGLTGPAEPVARRGLPPARRAALPSDTAANRSADGLRHDRAADPTDTPPPHPPTAYPDRSGPGAPLAPAPRERGPYAPHRTTRNEDH